ITLLEKYNITKLETSVMHFFYGCIWHWKELINGKVAQEKLLNAIQQGINIGNNEYVCYICINYGFVRFFGGVNLAQVEEDYREYTKLIKKISQEYSINYIEICKNIIVNLRNEVLDKYCLLLGTSQDEEDAYLEIYNNQNNQWLLFIYYFGKTLVSYFLKDYFMAFNNSQQAGKFVVAIGGYLPAPQHNFYSSLSLIAYYNDANAKKQKELLEQVEKNQESMKIWSQSCLENFQHKYNLVEAEKARILGQNWQAQEFYEKAIQGAKKYEFIHEEALAYERAAEFYLALGREEIGQLYLRNAHHCYNNWGAKAKVKQLEEEYPQYFIGVTNKSTSKSLNTTSSISGNDGEILDLTTVIKASQAISGEIKLKKLLNNLMKITIENAGAQKGFLILNHEGNWFIEAQGKINSDEVTILQSIPIESTDPKTSIPILPTTIINYVIRTQENIVLNDALQEGQFIDDPYIIATQSKSILCTPLINQAKLSGIIYLENNLTTEAFTSKRVELLNILSAQAAISIDNSRLYAKVRENESRLAQFLDAMPVGVAILDGSGHPYYFNQVAKELLGKEVVSDVTSEQIASTYQFYKISTGQQYRSHELPITRALQGESSTTEDIEVRQNNKVVPLESFSTPVYDEQGKIIYAIGSFIDITERKKAEADRQRFTNELFELNKAYERFVPNQFLQLLDKESIVDVELGDQVQ
ncbi:MAG: GAF domain-containing protein, partial [Okeania sp. SIO3C4]|nr:GAF domain-containing protein [Okeania sp. SIO3C4]